MKELVLMRHAKSDWSMEGQLDSERGLNKRGLKDAPFMGEMLLQKGIKPQLMITSPALRTRLTSQLVAEKVGYTAEILEVEELYESSGKQYMDVLRAISARVDSVMIVGHNPSLEELIDELLQMNLPHIEMPTSAIAILDVDCAAWSKLVSKSATLRAHYKPKDF